MRALTAAACVAIGAFVAPVAFADGWVVATPDGPIGRHVKPVYATTKATCEKWIGRQFLSRFDGDTAKCISGCVAFLKDARGSTAFYNLTGEPCKPEWNVKDGGEFGDLLPVPGKSLPAAQSSPDSSRK